MYLHTAIFINPYQNNLCNYFDLITEAYRAHLKPGRQDWANFRTLGDCLFWEFF
jgi:hypothetical protein